MAAIVVVLVIALALIVLVFFQRRSKKSKLLTPAEFAQEFAKHLATSMPANKVEIVSDREVRITRPAGKTATAFLDNAYTVYSRRPDALPSLLANFGAGLKEFGAAEVAIDRSRIVPIVKDRRWLVEVRQSVKARGKDEPPQNVYDDLNEELVVIYAEDSPKSIRYLIEKNLADLGIRREELRGLAVDNLKRLLPQIRVEPNPLFSAVKLDGNYEASVLLYEEIWTQPRVKVDGEIVVAVPARDVLLVTGSRNMAGIAKVRELAAQIARESPYRLTSEIFVYREGAFRKLPPQ